MHDDGIIPIALFAGIALIILVPVYLRHRLYIQQLDVIAKALERGVDPERIQLRMPVPEAGGDPNGNWKAGLILLGFGVFMLLVMGSLWFSGEMHSDPGARVSVVAAPAMFFIPGLILLYIHRTIVGRVVSRTERLGLRDGAAAGQLPV